MATVQDLVQIKNDHHKQYDAINPTATLKGAAEGKIIFITGASRGIGQATAVAFAQAGARGIYITARSKEALEETESQIRKANPNTTCVSSVCDVMDEEQVKAAVQNCVDVLGGIDTVDSNAGYLSYGKKIGETETAEWWKTWEINMKGTYYVIRYTMPHLIASAKKHAAAGSTGGHLILISSSGAQKVRKTASDYQTSKHAINRLAEFVQEDHGEDGIKCFAIHPGGVLTDLAKNLPTPIHAMLVDEPELAAGFCVWLSSGKADWLKGRYLSCNWDVNDLEGMRDEILNNDLLVNRLRVKAD
ncbi:hypothetical protein BZG36_00005 [Bifiguratus adelaidae]|uniref:Uncharacterized protein n=1 Tax=Bifiguratus adelaidae TaxID=1938954 RepID=A0A261Y8C8_9FUNG|nr:hypothetical protein BZG36_00005 [Bifiguratus adelaidae]